MRGNPPPTRAIVAACIIAISSPKSPAGQVGFTVGSHFTASSTNQSGFIPPDSDGAIGPDQFVELINGSYAVFDRGGKALLRTSLDQFWRDAGVTLTGSFTGDPRILYDASSGHWFASSLDGGSSSGLLVAVSNDADPLHGWKGFSFQPAGGGTADFDMLGIDKGSVYIASDLGTTVAILPKGDLIDGSIANRTVASAFGVGSAPQPIVGLGDTGLPHPILSDFSTAGGLEKISLITSASPPGAIDMTDHYIPVQRGLGNPVNVPQAGTSQLIDVGGGPRFSSSVVLADGNIWGVQTVLVDGRDALHWVRIDAVDYTLKEQGIISSPDLYYFYGSIAVDGDGDVAIGFNGSSPTTFPGAYAVVGKFDGTTTTFDVPALLKAGIAPYTLTAGDGRTRWGDYSATTVDPTNPDHFWTIQEYASGPDGWSTYVAELIPVPEPHSWVLGLTALGAGAVAWLRRGRGSS